jgi:hypothetical protein
VPRSCYMRFLGSAYVLVGLISGASATGLVSIQTATQPSLPAAGLEVNQGQAKAGILFLCRNKTSSLAVEAQSVLYSPLGAALSLVASNSNPAVRFSDPLPGLANYYAGANPQMWVTGVLRYGSATLAWVYPGVDAQFTSGANGVLTLNLVLAAGSNLQSVQFAIAQATSIAAGSDGSLRAQVGNPPEPPTIAYPPPVASQRLGRRTSKSGCEFRGSIG